MLHFMYQTQIINLVEGLKLLKLPSEAKVSNNNYWVLTFFEIIILISTLSEFRKYFEHILPLSSKFRPIEHILPVGNLVDQRVLKK